MSRMSTLEQTKRAAGLNDLRAPGRAPNYAYAVPFTFSTIASGASSSLTQKLTAAGAFVVNRITGIVRNTSGARVTDPDRLFVQLSANDGPLQLGEVDWLAIAGDASNPHYLTGMNYIVAPGASMVCSLRNGGASSVVPQLVLWGFILNT